ncbi:MAG: cysteine-rich CWC family protein [Limnohabitans sp.]
METEPAERKLEGMTQPVSTDPCLCPLCGKPNGCAMASAEGVTRTQPCWCVRENFSAQLLQRVPEPAKNRACICQACVQNAAQTT